jgi:hypothetical protein
MLWLEIWMMVSRLWNRFFLCSLLILLLQSTSQILYKKVDIPIILNDVTLAEDYDGDFQTRRNILLTFDFTAKTYVYGPEKKFKIISDTNIRNWDYLVGKSGAIEFIEVGVCGGISGYTSGSTYDTYKYNYELGVYGQTGAIDTYGNYIGPTYG